MKDRVVLCALCALLGCKQATVPETEQIALYYATSEQSKTDVLTQGDQIGVFASIEGTENFFIEHIKYVVGSDGRSLSTSPAVYYPEAKQAVAFAAYLPFGGVWNGAVGTFSVPADQSTTLKQADLCWAKASSTPMATPVPLEFAHKMAHLLVQTNTPTEKITIPNAFSGGTLDIRTGTFTNTLKSSVSTSGTELILPAQTVTRLVLTVSGVEYVFDGSISLETAKTTSINLTLNPTTKTATLSGSSTTNWISSATQGDPTQAVSNILTMHWPNYLPQGATPDKVTLTINNTDYTVSSGITYADKTFTVPFASSALRYPYTITKVAFNNLPMVCTHLLGATIYKSKASTVGIKDIPNAVFIGNLWWAKGNLVAAGARGTDSCRIGAPSDAGLYFQFGSLIGWKGGGVASGGTGEGFAPNSWLYAWGNVAYSWGNDAMCWPSELVGNPSGWPTSFTPGTNKWFFSNSSVSSGELNVNDPKNGVGDPCRYYLGHPWRLPTVVEMTALYNTGTSGVGWKMCNGTSGQYIGPGAVAQDLTESLFLTAYSMRYHLNGYFAASASDRYNGMRACMGTSTISGSSAFYLSWFNGTTFLVSESIARNYALSARCVQAAKPQ